MGSEAELASKFLRFPQSILDSAPVGMVILDRTGAVSWANRAAADILAADPASLAGRPVTTLVRPSDIDQVRAAFDRLTSDRTATWQSEGRWHTADGRDLWLQLSASALPRPDDDPAGSSESSDGAVICQFVDVTARKQAEAALADARRELERRNVELERSNADLTQFAYVASHDLSEPLRVISGHVELLAHRYRGALDADADRWIDFAVDGCNRMRTLIGDLLHYSRTGRDSPPPQPVDMNDIGRQAAVDLGQMIADADAQVRIGPLPTVDGHAGQMRQLLVNLIANAIKFSWPAIPPEVDVAASDDGAYWHFSVSDNGIGIPEEYREKIFGIFQRLHTRERYPGSGIGLAICRKIVELHGGTIWVDDAPDGGCTIRFTIAKE